MNLKLKNIFLITLFILINPIICSAKTIEIDNVSYDVTSTLEADNYIYNASTNTLTLKNANLKSIKTSNDLKIILEGDNYLISNDYLDTISGSKIEITGNGSLTIDSQKRGIYANQILINNTNLKVKSADVSIGCSSSSYYDLIINNSNLEIESLKDAFNVVSGNLYLNNSNIIVNKATTFLASFGKYLYINNTNLELKDVISIRYIQNYVYVNGFSKVSISNANNNFLSSNYILADNLIMYGSSDGINFYEVLSPSKDKYLKIENTLDLDLIKESYEKLELKDKELSLKEEKLNSLESDLSLKEEKLSLLESDLNVKEEKLKSLESDLSLKEEKLSLLESDLNVKEEKLNSLESDLNVKDNKLILLEDDLVTQKNNLDLKQLELEEKEGKLKMLEDDLLEELSNLAMKSSSLDKKEEELKTLSLNLENLDLKLQKEKEEFLKEKEEYDVLENVIVPNKETINCIENPKTYNSFVKYFLSLIISFLGMILLVFKIKKKKVVGDLID